MYRVFLTYPHKHVEKSFPTFNAVRDFLSNLNFPPVRIHVIFNGT